MGSAMMIKSRVFYYGQLEPCGMSWPTAKSLCIHLEQAVAYAIVRREGMMIFLYAYLAGSRLWCLDQDDTTPSRDSESLSNMLLLFM